MPAFKLPFQHSSTSPGLVSRTELYNPNSVTEKSVNKLDLLLKTFGLTPNLHSDEFISDCPFCQATEKFSMHIQTGQNRCFVCGFTGNTYSFINAIWMKHLESTTEEDYLALKKFRKDAVDVSILKEMQLAKNKITNEWLIPAWSQSGQNIANLYRYCKMYEGTSSYWTIRSSPTFSHVLYGVHLLRNSSRPIWIMEGHWDYYAMKSLLVRMSISIQYDIVAAPGAGTFPRKYLNLLNGRDLLLAFDNDEAGQKGVESLLQAFSQEGVTPTSIRTLAWPKDLPPKFDVSDTVISLPEKYRKIK